MITLNNREHPWREGLTVSQLLEDNDYVYKRIMVSINGQHVEEKDWGKRIINAGDNVSALHLMAGG